MFFKTLKNVFKELSNHPQEQCTNNWHSCHMQICQLKADANCRTIQQIGSEEFCKTNTTVQV